MEKRTLVGETPFNSGRAACVIKTYLSELRVQVRGNARLRRLIVGVSSRPGDTALDQLAGSGTIPTVAVSMGRMAVGIELNPTYAEIARARIA